MMSPRWMHRAIALALLLSLPVLVIWARHIDLPISALFFDPGLDRFPARGQPFPEAAHHAISLGARTMAAILISGLLLCLVMGRAIAGLPARAWGFLLCCLLVGPLLLANGLFKDHWGRARPMQVAEFGGAREFTPPLLIADQCERNCSFIAGDPSFGFMLHCLAYLPAPRRRRQWLFLAGIASGCAAGALRIWMGAHFFSDVVFSAVFMLMAAAAAHAAFYGWRNTRACWLDECRHVEKP